VWDIGGQDRIRKWWRHYYQGTNEDARDDLTKMMSEDELKGAALLVLANKQDLPNAMQVFAIADALEFCGDLCCRQQ